MHQHPIFWINYFKARCKATPMQESSHIRHAIPKFKKELQEFLGIMKYFSMFSMSTVEVCKPLCRPGREYIKTCLKKQKH